MAWFGEIKNLTGNLTGQLSNVANTAASFTRDVLAEGTEEVSDQSTELKIAQDKIRELQGLVTAQRSENERLKDLNHELADKAEASELQINTISQQYRRVLQEKHDELSVLKQQQQALQDVQQSMLAASTTAAASITHSTSTSSLSGSLVSSDEHDFGDVISSQHEINRLSNEVSRLRSECEHWRQMASVTAQGDKTGPMFEIGLDKDGASSSSAEEILQLKTRIKELERDLSREIDDSQRELSALQDAHSQKLATLGRRHKQEVEDYTQRIEQLEQLLQQPGDSSPTSPPTTPVHTPGSPPSKEAGDLQNKVKELQEALKKSQRNFNHLDESCKRLRVELEQVKQVEKEKSKTAEILKKQVEALKAEKAKGMQENETLRWVKRDLAGKLDAERQENARLLAEYDQVKSQTDDSREKLERLRKGEVLPLQEKLSKMEKEVEDLRRERDQASTSTTRQELHEARKKFSSGAMQRRTQLLKEKQALVNQMIDVGEQVSEGKTSVALLKAASEQMTDEAEDIITDMGGVEASEEDQDITPDLLHALEVENQQLRQRVEALETEVQQLSVSCTSLAEDKESCESLIVRLNQDLEAVRHTRTDFESRSRSGSQKTLECSGDSETESNARLPLAEADLLRKEEMKRIQYKRPDSPSGTSTDSDRTASSGRTPVQGYSTSESEVPGSQTSAVESSDNISFDGEYDDSIMFSGIKQRFPEAAHVLQEQIEHFELIRADWDMEKQALEEVVVRMREQLKEKDIELQSLTAKQGLREIETQQMDQLEEDLETLQDTVEKMEEEHTQMEQENSSLIQEKEALKKELNELQKEKKTIQEASEALQLEVQSLKSELRHAKAIAANLNQEVEGLRQLRESSSQEVESIKAELKQVQAAAKGYAKQAEEREEALHLQKEASLREDSDRDRLEADLLLLNQQHQQALDQIIKSRDEIREKADGLEVEKMELLSKLNDSQVGLTELDASRNRDKEDIKELREELDKRNSKLSDLSKQREDVEEEILNLRDELEDMGSIKKKLEDTNMELVLRANESKTTLERLEKELMQLKQHSQRMVSLEVKEQLDSSVSELESQLQFAVSSSEERKSTIQHLESRICELEDEVKNLTESKRTIDVAFEGSKAKLEVEVASSEQKAELLLSYEDEIHSLRREKEGLLRQLQQNKHEHESTLQELSQSRELDTSALQSEHEKLIQLKNAKETEVVKLKREYDELQADLSGTKDMLNSTLEGHQQLAEILKNKDDDIKNLAEENSYFFKALEESKTKVKQFEQIRDKLQETEDQLEDTKAKNEALSREIQRLQQDLKDQLERSDVETKTLEVITELEGEVRDLREVLEGKEEEAENLQRIIEEKQSAIVKWEEKSGNQRREYEESQTKILGLESEISSLKGDFLVTAQNLESISEDLQKSQEKLSHERAERQTVSDSQSVLFIEKDNQIIELNERLSSVKDQMKDQEVQHVKELHERNTEVSLLKDKLEKLRQELDSRQKNVSEMKVEHSLALKQKEDELSQLTDRLEQLTRDANLQKAAAPQEDRENGIIQEEVLIKRVPGLHNANTEPLQSRPVGQMSETIVESSLSDNEKHLENALQEKEKEIVLLKESNRSLTGLLEDKSHTAMGNVILVDLHKLQMQVRTYESERSQMMSVLNEKTRECSNLKNEVHRLVKVISAQKTALEKAQEDNKEIQRHLDTPQNDMQKQALQNLSRLIQDKDLEIEALKQKNDSLLQVLQTAEPNSSSDISKVLGDSEQLQKENKMLKEERDQLVVSIHQKHHESLTYYEEVQRLVGVVNEETHKQAELQQRYNSVYADLDDKEKSLSQLALDIEQRDSSLANLQKQLEKKDQSILDLESQLSDMNESVVKQSEELTELANVSQVQEENDHLSALLRTKDEEISDLRASIQAQSERVQLPGISAASEGLIRAEVATVQSAPPPNGETLARKEAEIVQLNEQLEHQTKTLAKRDSAIRIKQEELQHRVEELAALRQEVDVQNQAILERDAALQLKNHQLQTLTSESKSKDVELHGLRSQNQTLSVQLQGFQAENEGLKKDNQALQHAVHNKDGEGRALQDTCNRLAAQVREKEFEIGALKEKNQTLTTLVQQREEGQSGELQRLLRETEAMQKQAQMFQQERDQALLALQRHQADQEALQTEVRSSREREQKLVGELDRLRSHLLQVEEGYTREALQGEEREKELRNRLIAAEEAARTSSSAVHSASKEASSQIESLLDQLHSVTSQKDQALLQLGEAQEQVQQYSTSLANLQMVLEQFTQEKEAAVAADVERYKVRAEEKSKVSEQLFKQTVELQERLAATTEALEAASRLNEQLDRKEEVAVHLREELAKKEELLHEYEARFNELGSANESKVDKPLMKNLLLGYFSAPQKKRPEILKLLGSVLNFSSEELQKIGAEGSQGGWLSGLLGRGTPTSTPPSTPRKTALESSFTEQFVKFLEHESTPTPKARLPLEEMTQEKPRSPRGPAFNPFSAPVPQFSPFIQQHPETPRPQGEPHQFTKPVLAPKSVLPAVPTIAPVVIPDASGRSSPSSKGTPAGLKDILQSQ
ncbi:thyroid receptor-interacting protein 11-like isoform X2 [Acanthaster planci]|uniref:Thyroid receptor-interacting protein 11-like isoform X2 n=1 Tax=Acanthaster planci TaxID=133434 RepID=A0A8B7Y6Y9_ACAPL|nr:thyroid receptor-interacting protein 11-like isoform X2 [Acanthaster planci]